MDMSRMTVDDLAVTHMKRYHFSENIHPAGATPWDERTPQYQAQLNELGKQLESLENIHLVIVRPRAIDVFLLEKDKESWKKTDANVRKILEDY